MTDNSIRLIAGLGNPGPEHVLNRHNAGFWFVDALARGEGGLFKYERRFQSELCRLQIRGHDVRLLKPATFMNRSGQAVRAAADYFKFDVREILVVHDELDLPTGTVRLKRGGGHGGHNGVRDVIAHMGREFHRLRLGVGRPANGEDGVDYVLRRAPKSEEDRIVDAISEATDVLPILLDDGPEKAMHKLHTRPNAEKDDDADS